MSVVDRLYEESLSEVAGPGRFPISADVNVRTTIPAANCT